MSFFTEYYYFLKCNTENNRQITNLNKRINIKKNKHRNSYFRTLYNVINNNTINTHKHLLMIANNSTRRPKCRQKQCFICTHTLHTIIV